jgi:2-methylcitrate dehydratase PrpD
MASWEDGSAAKSLHAGFSACAAISATSCAKHGVSGPRGVFDGRFGFFKAHVQEKHYHFAFTRVTDGLGETWEALNIAPKAYPCGHYNQPLIKGALTLREQHGITPEKISAIRCSVPEYVMPLVAEPAAEKRRPKTSFHGRFSLQHSIAEAMMQGALDKSSFEERNLTDPRYNDLADKVQAIVDPFAKDRTQLGGRVEVALYDGRTFSCTVEHMLGMPQNPMSESDLARQFQMNATGFMPAARIDRVTDIIMSLERLDDTRLLMAEL